MCMEPISTMTLRVRPAYGAAPASAGPSFENGAVECYKASVNESETITEAQPLSLGHCRRDASERRDLGLWYPAAPQIERS
jgi:hypothetical protein